MEVTESIKQMIDRVIGNSNWSERVMEIPFLIKHLPNPPKKVLDVGCYESRLLIELKEIEFDIYGIDLIDYQFQFSNFIKMDARNMIFENNSFDVCYSISTIEHVGLPDTIYKTDTELDEDGDKKVVSEMVRITKPNGIIILTLPYGKCDDSRLLSWIKFYNKDRISRIIPNNLIIDKIIYSHCKDDKWIETDENVAATNYSHWSDAVGVFVTANACILGHKIEQEK